MSRRLSITFETMSLTERRLEHLQDVAGIMGRNYNEALSNLPYEQRPADTQLFYNETIYALHYATFAFHGRNIFHFEPEMIERFKQTDVDNVPVSALAFPYNAFYMSFGFQEDLELRPEEYYVDGAYIITHPGLSLQIVLSTMRNDVDYQNRVNWIFKPDI